MTLLAKHARVRYYLYFFYSLLKRSKEQSNEGITKPFFIVVFVYLLTRGVRILKVSNTNRISLLNSIHPNSARKIV